MMRTFKLKMHVVCSMAVCLGFMGACCLPAYAGNRVNTLLQTDQTGNITVTGTVTDEKGEPIIGATVKEKGTSNGVITDFDGNFILNVASKAVLQVSYVGYSEQVIPVNGKSKINIVLKESLEQLDEVVVTGYTTQRKADLTGAVAVVNVNEIRKMGENNPMKTLQGRVPGMYITADGTPSGAATVRIRGIGTMNNNDPLYIIDGVPTTAGMHELNGNDIESIQVLKDASAATIYGSRAANGVIIITTKKGKEGKININFDASISASLYQTKLKMMNTEQYGRTLWQANVNDGYDPNANVTGYRFNWGYDSDGYPVLYSMSLPKYLDADNTIATSAGTDWFDEITRTGTIQQYNLSVTNGTDKGSYFFSLGYYNNEGLIKYTNFDRISARMNSEYKLLKDIITVGENFTLNRTTEVQAPANVISDAMISLPMIPVHTVDGTGWGGPSTTMPDRQNIARVVYDNKDNKYTYWRMFGDAHVNINPLKGLNIRSTFGLDYAQKLAMTYTLPYTNGVLSNSQNAVNMSQEHWTKWMWNAVATYNLDKNGHRLDLMAGTELNREDDVNLSAYREDFAIISTTYMYPDAGSGTMQSGGSASSYSLASFFGKVNYSFDDRYLASFTIRRDGSSRFGKNNRWAMFPAFSLGWRINQEKFMESAGSVLSDLKLRFAWGQTGNQTIDNTARYSIYEANYGTGDAPTYGTSYDIEGTNGGRQLQSGFRRTQLQNDDLKWETTSQTNVGIDFSLFNNDLYGSVEYYDKKTKDILIKPSYIGVMGEGGGQWRNVGKMQNSGVEINIGYRHDTSYGFSYDINANMSFNRNKVCFVPDDVASTGDFGGNGVMNIIGHSINMYAGYIADGLFKTQAEVDEYLSQYDVRVGSPGLGRIRYKDVNGDNIIDSGDQTWIGNPNPDFTYGINISLKYKGFDLTTFWQGVQNVDVDVSAIKQNSDFWALGDMNANRTTRLLNAWTPANAGSSIPAVSTSDLNYESRFSSYFIENGSYLKLRMLQLGYTFDEKLVKNIGIHTLRLYLSAQNVLTIKSKKFTCIDPENPTTGYPIPLNLTFGFNVEF
ncbi:MAG: TonB-dependent receptor [Prevotellaceae bacterium]|nr:TonB-dependent receptor [Prevotellaceae bacterium]